MFHIQWLNISLFFLTCFPGILLLILRMTDIFKYTPDFFKYIISLIVVIIITSVFAINKYITLLTGSIFLLVPIFCYLFEMFVSNHEFNLHVITRNSRIPLTAILVYPLLEEMNFRYNLYFICVMFKLSIWQYLVLSILTFTFSHIIYQGTTSTKKIIFATIQCFIFIYTQNLFFVIGTHILFNVLVYFDKANRNGRFDF